MLSAGLIGGPGLGYAKDRFAGEELKAKDAALFEKHKAAQPSMFLNIASTAATGLDGKALGKANDALGAARKEVDATKGDPATAIEKLEAKDRTLIEASMAGDRRTLKADSYIPAGMAVIYLILLAYFKAIGGYKPVKIDEDSVADVKTPVAV